MRTRWSYDIIIQNSRRDDLARTLVTSRVNPNRPCATTTPLLHISMSLIVCVKASILHTWLLGMNRPFMLGSTYIMSRQGWIFNFTMLPPRKVRETIGTIRRKTKHETTCHVGGLQLTAVRGRMRLNGSEKHDFIFIHQFPTMYANVYQCYHFFYQLSCNMHDRCFFYHDQRRCISPVRFRN